MNKLKAGIAVFLGLFCALSVAQMGGGGIGGIPSVFTGDKTFKNDVTISETGGDTFLKITNDDTNNGVIRFADGSVLNSQIAALPSTNALVIQKWDATGTTLTGQLTFGAAGGMTYTNDITVTGNVVEIDPSGSETPGFILDSPTGWNSNFYFQENNVNQALILHQSASDVLRIIKYLDNGASEAVRLNFEESGILDLATGDFQVSAGDVAITDSGSSTDISVYSAANYNGNLLFYESSVGIQAAIQHNYTGDDLRLIKHNDSGTPVAQMELNEDGTIDVSIGTLQQGGTNVCLEDGTNCATGSQPSYAYKTANESRTSTTTVTKDGDLAIVADSTGFYDIEAYLEIDGPGAGDFKFKIAHDTAASNFGRMVWVQSDGTTGTVGEDIEQAITIAAATDGITIRGTIELNSVTANDEIAVHWAQNSSNGTPTNLRTNSWLKVTRMGSL